MGGGGMFVGIYMFGGCGCGVGWRFEGKLIVWVWVVRLYGFGLNFFKIKKILLIFMVYVIINCILFLLNVSGFFIKIYMRGNLF